MATGPRSDPLRLGLLALAGYLAVGGCGALNGYLERESDRRMERTASRAVPAGRVSPRSALLWSIILLAGGHLAALALNPLTLLFVAAGASTYLGVYTLWLKRRTPWNIVIGGAAGSFAPLAGWSAATGQAGAPAAILGLLIFLWTPGHFWGLAIRYREDYERASIPMLPVRVGAARAARYTALSNFLMVPAALLLVPTYGPLYGLPVAALGAYFALENIGLLRDAERGHRVFRASILYLTCLLMLLVVLPLAQPIFS
ncbi:MAG: protoheme IX farnesyltransferase, partial [Euryarchaeota archaeon]|nr:protoheme IX farnesyltransferase [Euryarchaeota archaeon]